MWDIPDLGVNGVLRAPFTPKSGGLPRRFLETLTHSILIRCLDILHIFPL